MKIVISKRKSEDGYYTKIVNEYMNQRSEMYFPLQLGKNVGDLEYGLYEVDGFLSCFTNKEGEVKPKLIITSAKPTKKFEDKSNSEIIKDVMTEENDPFANAFEEFGEQLEADLDNNYLE